MKRDTYVVLNNRIDYFDTLGLNNLTQTEIANYDNRGARASTNVRFRTILRYEGQFL